MNNLLDIRDLHVCFKGNRGAVKAVDGVNLTLERGQVTAIVGESGSGKTTTVMTVMGLLSRGTPPEITGQVLFESEDLLIKSNKEMQKIRGKEIGMVFQEPLTALNPAINIGEQIEEVLKIHGWRDRKERQIRALEVMREVGLPDPQKFYHYFPGQLSGGLRQRVVIAMAIVCNPKLVIADEPTTALDVTIQAQILSLLKKLRQAHQLSILLITHDFGVVAEIADVVTVMYHGKVLEQGPVKEIFQHSCHPYTIGLMKCIPNVGTKQETLYTIPKPDTHSTGKNRTGCPFYDRCFLKEKRCAEQEPGLVNISSTHQTRCLRWEELKDGYSIA